MELTEAKRLAVKLVSPKGTEWVVLEQALGRVLAETITAGRDFPQEARSRMDGFAVRSEDTSEASSETPAVLTIRTDPVAAGHVSPQRLEAGECVRIFTGAPLPIGADSVIPEEEASERENLLIVKNSIEPGKWIIFPGSEVRRGELVALKGKLLTPTRLALIAALGQARIPVYRQPRVALLATGDEVREVEALTEGPRTTCNNRHLLSWLVRLQGGRPFSLGVVGDDPGAIAERLENADSDLVMTTGGMGRGGRDFILQVWDRLGIQVLFDRINLSPGKNCALGTRLFCEGNRERQQIFCGLPGTPWAARIIFEEILAPLFRRWQGMELCESPSVTAVLKSLVKNKKGNYKAIRGRLDMRTSPPCFIPSSREETLFGALRDNPAYVLVAPQSEEIRAGTEVQVRLNDFPLLALPWFGPE